MGRIGDDGGGSPTAGVIGVIVFGLDGEQCDDSRQMLLDRAVRCLREERERGGRGGGEEVRRGRRGGGRVRGKAIGRIGGRRVRGRAIVLLGGHAHVGHRNGAQELRPGSYTGWSLQVTGASQGKADASSYMQGQGESLMPTRARGRVSLSVSLSLSLSPSLMPPSYHTPW